MGSDRTGAASEKGPLVINNVQWMAIPAGEATAGCETKAV